MTIEPINLAEALARIDDVYSPRIVARVNDYDVRIAHARGEHVWHVHLKDVLAVGEPHEPCRWGDGVVPVEECVRMLQHIGYTGSIAVEHEPETFDPTDEIRAMRDQLAGWLA